MTAYRFRGGGKFTTNETRSGKSFVEAGRQVTINGDHFQLTWNGPALTQAIEQALISAFEQLSDEALNYMQSIVPVDTGLLQDSCIAYVTTENGRISMVIGNTAFYAIYVELGSVRNYAQPFMRPTFDYIIKALPGIVRGEVKRRSNGYAT
jgi:HK97 gp10 family phage protein